MTHANSATVIGMVHFSPLEGDPAFPGKQLVRERAEQDLAALLTGGVDVVMFENNFDDPKFAELPPTQAAHFEELVRELVAMLTIPWGICALWNDYKLGFQLCQKYGGTMVRVPVFVDSVETVYGTFFADPVRVIQTRKELRAEDIKLLADVQVKHAKILNPRPLPESIQEALTAGADAIIITGNWTGDPPSVAMVKEAKETCPQAHILIGSGMTPQNIKDFIPYIDGCIVGTAFKEMVGEKKLTGPNIVGSEVRYSLERISAFVAAAHEA